MFEFFFFFTSGEISCILIISVAMTPPHMTTPINTRMMGTTMAIAALPTVISCVSESSISP